MCIRDRLLGSAYIEVEPIKGLKLKANLGIDRKYQKRKTYLPKTTQYGAAAVSYTHLDVYKRQGDQRTVVTSVLMNKVLLINVINKKSGSTGTDIQDTVFSLV